MIKRYIFISLILITSILPVDSQIPDQPAMPLLYKVTVDPFTGYDSIIWYPQTDTLIDYYAVCHPKITNPNYPYVLGEPIGYVNPGTFFYVNENSASGAESVGYSVIAVHVRDDSTTVQSAFDYPDSTIFLTAAFDSCKAEVRLTWNKYNKWTGNTDSYRIYQVVSGNDPEIVAIIALEDITSHVLSISENLQINYFVEALHKDKLRSSRSNMVTVHTDMLAIPDYIVAANANPAGNNSLQLTFYVDHASELSEYQLLRSESINGTYQLVKTFTDTDYIISVYDEINPNTTIYYYKLAALNKCSENIRTSNIINNIILNVSNTNLTNQLVWNGIEGWEGETEKHVIYRRNAESSETDSFVVSGQLSFTDDLTSYFEELQASSGVFCYRVKTSEINNPHHINSIAYSNEICISVTPGLNVPNAFIPNNPTGENDRFRPVFVFEPLSYEMTIYNRWGNKIWEGEGPWDGMSDNEFVPEGTYVYQLRVVYPDNIITKSGFVTVIYR